LNCIAGCFGFALEGFLMGLLDAVKGKKKKAFGGYSISFKGCDDTMEDVFGSGDLAPSEMTKKIWAYVKKKGLAGKK
jgi:hypothetical protein